MPQRRPIGVDNGSSDAGAADAQHRLQQQQRLDELDAQLKRVFAQQPASSTAGNALARAATSSASAAGSAVVQYALGSTLLPQGIAELISNISLLARLSLKCSAFFIEVIIEAARLSTGAGLGITRRALIAAVASARNVSSLAIGPPPTGQNDGAAVNELAKSTTTSGPANHAFLTVLDRYTSLGIYVIHHTFTLAELFAMSGFHLTASGIKAGLGAADESVRLVDQIFGSNETSRALSSFIALARREFGEEGVTGTGGFTGTVKTLAYLTKAITAFAVLQNMTYRRSHAEHGLKVIYDCTVLGQAETNSWRAKLWGTASFVPARKASLVVGSSTGQHALALLPHGQLPPPSRSNAQPSTRRSRPSSFLATLSGEQPCITSLDLSKRGTLPTGGPDGETTTEEDSLMAELDFLVGGDDEDDDDGPRTLVKEEVNDGDDTLMQTSDAPKGSIVSRKELVRPAELTDEMRLVLQQCGERELENGVIVSQETEPRTRREVRRVVRKKGGSTSGLKGQKSEQGDDGDCDVVFEVITEIVETTETTTTVQAAPSSSGQASGSAAAGAGASSGSILSPDRASKALTTTSSKGNTSNSSQRKQTLPSWVPSMLHPLKAGERRTERDVTETRSAVDTESIYDDRVERTRMEEDTWCEISTSAQHSASHHRNGQGHGREPLSPEQFGGALQRLSSVEGLSRPSTSHSHSHSVPISEDEVEHELILGEDGTGFIPTLPNGAPATAAALRESIEQPEMSKARMQVVLKTMTRKLVQRKRILRRITVKDRAGPDGEVVVQELGRDEDEDDVAVRQLLDAGSDRDGEEEGAMSPASHSSISESGLRSPIQTTGAGLGLSFGNGKGRAKDRLLRETIEYGSSPASSEGARTPRRGSIAAPAPSGGGGETSNNTRKGSAMGTLFGRARDAVRSSSRSTSVARASGQPSTSGRGGQADSSDVSMESLSSTPKHGTSGSARSPRKVSTRALSPAPAVPTRARNNISATATPITTANVSGGSGSTAVPALASINSRASTPGDSGTQRETKRMSKRASKIGVPFLGAQYDPSIEASGSAGGAGTSSTKGLLHSPPMISSRRHSRAPSVTSVHSYTSRTHTHTNTTAHSTPYLNTSSEGTIHGRPTGGRDRGGGGGGGTAPFPTPLAPELGPNFPGEPTGAEGNAYFPHGHLVKHLHRFMRHSSAAYGQNFMRIFGIGSAEFFFPDTGRHHANVWSFAHHVGLEVDKILLSSYTEEGTGPFHSDKMSPLINYVSVDDESEAIVFTCRGTLGLSDFLTDLTCTYEPIEVQGGNPECDYKVHAGMLHSARQFRAQSSTVFSTIQRGLEEHDDYGLVLAGHSLGGGVCAILAVLWSVPAPIFLRQIEEMRAKGIQPPRYPPITTPFVTSLHSGLPPGRPIHAYAYGPPATTTADLGRYCRGLVTSLTHGYDMVPFFSLGSVRDLKNVAKSLAEERESDVAQEIVARTIGLLQHRRADKSLAAGRGAGGAGSIEGGQGSPQLPQLAGFDGHSLSQAQPRAEERIQSVELDELAVGRTSNRATRPGYRDPNLSRPPPPAASPTDPTAEADDSNGMFSGSVQDDIESDAELAQWLWAVIKTMRADMKEEKLYPPGHVYCIESFAVFVTPRMSQASSSHQRQYDMDRLRDSKGRAHRVVLRYCPDVEKRFSEILWSMSMLRDHIPNNYEFCTQLLCESIFPGEHDTELG